MTPDDRKKWLALLIDATPEEISHEDDLGPVLDVLIAAVAEEREVCAKVAREWRDANLPGDVTGCNTAYSEGQRCSAPEGIAAAIETRQ